MKLCRLRKGAKVLPGALVDDVHYDLSSVVPDFDADFFAGDGLDRLTGFDLSALPEVADHEGFAPAISGPSKIVCVGLNYFDHAKEAGMEIPEEPVIFLKAPSSLSGATDPIPYPPTARMLDWEVELALVIGRRTKYATADTAIGSVAGYMILNDVSDRHWQLKRSGQWTKGKSHDGFTPIGPYLALAHTVADPHGLSMELKVNATTMQKGSTSDFIFDIPTVIAHVSEFMTLEPGDIITTGTPAGVGFGMDPQVFLKPGDLVEVTIAGLGTQRQTVVAGG